MLASTASALDCCWDGYLANIPGAVLTYLEWGGALFFGSDRAVGIARDGVCSSKAVISACAADQLS